MKRMASMALLLALVVLAYAHVAHGDSSWNYNGVNNKGQAMKMAKAYGWSRAPDAGPSSQNTGRLMAMYQDWVRTYGLADPNDKTAFANFAANMAVVISVNLDASLDYWASGNEFSHMSLAQFSQGYLGSLPPNDDSGRRLTLEDQNPTLAETTSANQLGGRKLLKGDANGASRDRRSLIAYAPTATHVNWTHIGYVTPVRNQGGCSSCWAFAATAVVESAYLMSGRGKAATLDLSEQQLVSCGTSTYSPYNNAGCYGGYPNLGIDYVANWKPLDKEVLYPYTASGSACVTTQLASATSGNAVQLTSGSIRVSPTLSQSAMLAAIRRAPTAIYMMVDSTFQNYRGGIYKPTTCTASVNHAMLATGFDSKTGFFIIKNSWGSYWGESGYIRVAMTGDGTGPCGMYQWAYQANASIVSTPLS